MGDRCCRWKKTRYVPRAHQNTVPICFCGAMMVLRLSVSTNEAVFVHLELGGNRFVDRVYRGTLRVNVYSKKPKALNDTWSGLRWNPFLCLQGLGPNCCCGMWTLMIVRDTRALSPETRRFPGTFCPTSNFDPIYPTLTFRASYSPNFGRPCTEVCLRPVVPRFWYFVVGTVRDCSSSTQGNHGRSPGSHSQHHRQHQPTPTWTASWIVVFGKF